MSFARKLGERGAGALASMARSLREGTPISRRDVLAGTATALLAGEVFSLAACGNKSTAYSPDQVSNGISYKDYERGLEDLTNPVQRSMVIIEGRSQGNVANGHGVIIADDPTNPNSHLSLVTAYHVPADLQGMQMNMIVSGLGSLDLSSIKFSLIQGNQDPLADPNNLGYGVSVASLDNIPNVSAIRQAIAQGQIVPGLYPPNAYDILTDTNTDPVMIMADGTKQNNGKLAEIALAYRNDTSSNIETSFNSGGMCQGDSGAPIYKGTKQADGSVLMSNVVLGVVAGFWPPTTIPGEGSFYNCSNDSINFTPLPNR